MKNETFYQMLKPRPAPRGLKFLLYSTLFVELLTFVFPSLISSLGLSFLTLKQGSIWQLVSYFFLPLDPHFSFSSVVQVIFSLYFLWVFGSSLIERIGYAKFFLLYFLSGIFSGLAAALLSSALHNPQFLLLGNNGPMYAMTASWALLNPKATLFLFFVIPFRMVQFLLFVVGGIFFLYLIHGQWIPLTQGATSLLIGYLFTLFFVLSPALLIAHWKKIFSKKKGEVYDFTTGQKIEREEQYLDEMLAKISQFGEKSLTFWEKRKMKKILKRRKKSK